MGLGCLLFPLRFVVTLVFGVLIFLAFIVYLALNAVSDNVLSADFYTDTLADNRVYDRFYDEVLVDPEYEETKDELLGDIDVPIEDIAGVAKGIMPPDYLQNEVERTINATVDYLKKDADTLELYIDLATPMENAKDELIGYVDEQIEELEVVEALTREDLEEQIDVVFRQVEAGEIPTQVPSLESIPVHERLAAYEEVLAALEDDPDIPQEIIEALEDPETDRAIREALTMEDPVESEDLRAVLAEATEGLATPLIDDALDELRRKLVTPEGQSCENLQPGQAAVIIRVEGQASAQSGTLADCTRYDVLQLAADGRDQTKEEFLSELDDARDVIELVDKFGVSAAILVMVVASGFIAFVHLPRLSSSLRWPGMILGLTGLVFLIVGLVLNLSLPDRLDSAVEEGVERTDLPESVFLIATDVVRDMAGDVTSGFIGPSIILLIIGAALFFASWFLRLIPFMLLPIPRR